MPLSTPIISVVDDDASFRIAVTRLLRATGYGVRAFASAAEFLQAARDGAPGCAIVDLKMPGMTGLELQNELAKQHNSIPLIFLTGHGEIPDSVQAMRHGAEDFLMKPVKKYLLLEAVQRALFRDQVERAKQARLNGLAIRFATLTAREREVLEQILSGRLNKQAAADLGISERTIKAHRANIMAKLEVQSVAELARMAEELGFLR